MPFDVAAEYFKDYFLSGAVPYGKELTESWASLQARIRAGNFAGIHIGDYKTIQLTTGETVVMEVAGIDQYYRCCSVEIGHHVDFISRDCLVGAKVFNDENDNNNGTATEKNPWRASKLFQTLNDPTSGVLATLPADLKACIIEKIALLEHRYSEAGKVDTNTGWEWGTMGMLWLPTEVEVFGHHAWSEPGNGTGGGGCNLQYPIFHGGTLHIIKGVGYGGGGSRNNWWAASACRQTFVTVCLVSFAGSARAWGASTEGVYAPLCFRIG